ncbi:helix-turn-helix domain-containing protein [Rhizobium rhizogenes]|uniref:helix-turn-helix transcriptional regulator n=1 Tax=Rhizobium rhizogenes TaxID=359 RepID=UPI0022BBBF8E|nr:helix-turn-helix domain-containing protein [Rhizobium rhizogenes]MCZ7480536.1 helix-turn-helix domain-containing protein [Rhizobium rhizogenes]
MEYMTASQIKERYQVTDMTLWRWLRKESLRFPQPIVINRRRLFKREEVEAWEKQQAKGNA